MVKYITLLASLFLLSCHVKNQETPKKTIYLTTNANDVYAFDIEQKKLKWHYPGFNLKVNDEVNYFILDDKMMTKAYQDGTIIQFEKKSGKPVWQMQDKEDESQSYYGYDFIEVAFLLFYQYPLVYQGNIIFGNSHGEIKSINIQTKKMNWVYIQPHIIYSSPKILNNVLYVNINGGIITLDPKTGKKISSINYKANEPVTNEIMIDNGNIYYLSQNNLLSCITPQFNLNWKFKADEEASQSSTHNLLFDKDNVYFGGNILYAIDKENGALQWKITLYDNNSSQNELLSVAQSEDGLIVLTREEILKIDKKGKIIARKKPHEEPIGVLYACNDFYYYLCKDGTLYSIDNNLQNEASFYTGITLDPQHRVDNTYLYAE